MAARKCPVCARTYENLNIFQDPVRTCLPCYASRPANHDLRDKIFIEDADPVIAQRAWNELRMRAARSKYARIRRQSNAAFLPGFIDIGDSKREIAMHASVGALDLGSDLQPCDGCGRKFEELHELVAMPSEAKALLCKGCLEADVDKQCNSCMTRVPLRIMHTNGTGRFYCPDCQPKAAERGLV